MRPNSKTICSRTSRNISLKLLSRKWSISNNKSNHCSNNTKQRAQDHQISLWTKDSIYQSLTRLRLKNSTRRKMALFSQRNYSIFLFLLSQNSFQLKLRIKKCKSYTVITEKLNNLSTNGPACYGPNQIVKFSKQEQIDLTN